MAASHFFVGLAAGAALLTLPLLAFTPGLDVPGRVEAWIQGPPPTANSGLNNELVSRPVRGYVPGAPGAAAAGGSDGSAEVAAPPTLAPAARPTAVPPTPQPTPVVIAARGLQTGVIRGDGQAVYVRHAAGVESSNDPVLADGSPVLVSAGPGLRVGEDQWRGVRGLNGVVGWVLAAQVQVDGEPAPATTVQQPGGGPVQANTAAPAAASSGGVPQALLGRGPQTAQQAVAAATTGQSGQQAAATTAQSGQQASAAIGQSGQQTAAATGQSGHQAAITTGQTPPAQLRVRIVNTGGVGVVLRRSPNDADRTSAGLADGATVAVVESQGSDWVHVHADNGLDGWVPAQYVTPAN